MTSLGDARRYAARPLRTVHTAHGPYLDFATVQHDVRRLSVASYANTPPTSAAAVPSFGLMRRPLERLASHYDYIHWGPRSKWATLWKGQDTSALPRLVRGAPRRRVRRPRRAHAKQPQAAARAPGAFRCLQNLLRAHRASTLNCTARAHPFPRQLAYFCGAAHAWCARGPARSRAKANIDNDFVMVRGEFRACGVGRRASPDRASRADSRDAGRARRTTRGLRPCARAWLPALFGGAVDTLARIGPRG